LKFLPACVRRVFNSWFNNALATIVKRHKSDVGHQNLHSTWEHWSPNMKRLHVMVRWPDQSGVIICKTRTCARSHRQSHPLRRILQQQGLSQSLRRNQKTVSGRGSAVDIASRPEDQKGIKYTNTKKHREQRWSRREQLSRNKSAEWGNMEMSLSLRMSTSTTCSARERRNRSRGRMLWVESKWRRGPWMRETWMYVEASHLKGGG
jgi:hypothetical protein